jgi:hypothetical protein
VIEWHSTGAQANSLRYKKPNQDITKEERRDRAPLQMSLLLLDPVATAPGSVFVWRCSSLPAEDKGA